MPDWIPPGYCTLSWAGVPNEKRYLLTIRIAAIFIYRLAALVEDGAVVRELGYSGSDVARYSGVTNSCVTRFVASGKRPDVDDLIRKL